MALKPEWLDEVLPEPVQHPETVMGHVLKVAGRVVGSMLLLTLVLGALLSVPSAPVKAQVAYDRTAAVNWALNNNRNDFGLYGYSSGHGDGRDCTTLISHALNAGGISVPTWQSNVQLIRWIEPNLNSLVEFRPINQLEKGDIILYSIYSDANSRWNYIGNTGGSEWSLWAHVALVSKPGYVTQWNPEISEMPDSVLQVWNHETQQMVAPYRLGIHIKTSGSTSSKPGVPTITSPGEGQTFLPGNINIAWTTGALNHTGQADFNVQISSDPTFNPVNVFFARPSYVGTSVTASITTPGTYFVRVHQGDRVSVTGDWTPTRTFRVAATLPPPPPSSGSVQFFSQGSELKANVTGSSPGKYNFSDTLQYPDPGAGYYNTDFQSESSGPFSGTNAFSVGVHAPERIGWERLVVRPSNNAWVASAGCLSNGSSCIQSWSASGEHAFYGPTNDGQCLRDEPASSPDCSASQPTPLPPTPLPPTELKVVAQSAQSNAALGDSVTVDLSVIGAIVKPFKALELNCSTTGGTVLKGISTTKGSLFSGSGSVGTFVGSNSFILNAAFNYMIARGNQDANITTDGVALRLSYTANAVGSATIMCQASIVTAANELIRNVPFEAIVINIANPFGSIVGKVQLSHSTKSDGILVEIRDASNTVVKTMTTNAAGEFSAEGLTPGQYQVTARIPGYQAAQTKTAVTVTAGQAKTLSTVVMLAGDSDADLEIGLLDLALYGSSYTAQLTASTLDFDYDRSGETNLVDYVALVENLFGVPADWR